MTKNIKGAQSGPFTVPAGENRVVPVGAAQFLSCLSSNQDFLVSVNGSSRLFFAEGIAWETDGLDTFNEFMIINEDNASSLNVTMAWGYGNMQDRRLSASGILEVDNPAGGSLNVHDNDLETTLSGLLKQTNNEYRSPLTVIRDYAGVTNSNQVINSGGANNPNGIIISTFNANGSGSADLIVDGNVIMRARSGAAGNGNSICEKDMLVRPGESLEIDASSGSSAYITYEVL